MDSGSSGSADKGTMHRISHVLHHLSATCRVSKHLAEHTATPNQIMKWVMSTQRACRGMWPAP
eukprot:6489689-Amphidinium_carterae.4